MNDFFAEIPNYIQILLTAGTILALGVSRLVAKRVVRTHGSKSDKSDVARISYVTKAINFGFTMFFISIIAIIWEISFQGLSIYFASFFTIAGVALFAQWSILSNITASVILFFFYPYKIGSSVKIMDGTNSVEGLILDITLFTIIIQQSDGNMITYPNSLAMQKPMQTMS